MLGPAMMRARPRRLRIWTAPEDLEEGLFGQVLLWVFEVLPWLAERGIAPEWDIRSKLYGLGPDWRVLPGLFDVRPPADLAGQRPGRPWLRSQRLLSVRVAHVHVLGNDWQALHGLWSRYFQVPQAIQDRAAALGLSDRTLGLHYRGTDKNSSPDTNPVSLADFQHLAEAFLAEHPGLDMVFLATDEPEAFRRLGPRLSGRPVVYLGDVGFHKSGLPDQGRAERALLDCWLLSRCAAVLKCSSALSGFAKVLRPELPCYRVSASKVFFEVPYFPDAHIPRLRLQDPAAQAILDRLFTGDWLDQPGAAARYRGSFVSQPRYGARAVLINWLKYQVSVLLGRPRRA